jgi:CRISPR-associated protein Cas1
MKKLLNVLYVQTQGAYLRLDHETVVMEIEGKTAKQMPLHPLAAIAVYGNIMLSPHLIAKCASEGRSVAFFDMFGRYQYRVEGPVSGNVLLRRAQHEALSSKARTAAIARNLLAGKIQNCRQVMLRGAREAEDDASREILSTSAQYHADSLKRLEGETDPDTIRGIEGMAAASYFAAFASLIRTSDPNIKFGGRTRRPPRDPVNALLSYIYTMLRFDCESALEGVGLDPQVGFLHTLRPGRPALALDLMEELRPVLADRLALTLINRGQITSDEFENRSGGSVFLNEKGRKTVILAWQERKQEELTHPVLKKKVPYGLISHVQARLLARHLRGDIPEYPPFLWR